MKFWVLGFGVEGRGFRKKARNKRWVALKQGRARWGWPLHPALWGGGLANSVHTMEWGGKRWPGWRRPLAAYTLTGSFKVKWTAAKCPTLASFLESWASQAKPSARRSTSYPASSSLPTPPVLWFPFAWLSGKPPTSGLALWGRS